MTISLKSKLGNIPCCIKNCTIRRCPYYHQNQTRCKRPRCDDEEFYAKWSGKVEEREKLCFAVFCSCSSIDPHFCKCISIV